MPQNRPRLNLDPEPKPVSIRQQPTRRLTGSKAAQKQDVRRAPIVESGLAIEPENLGVQFLRGATETEQEASGLELRGEAGLPIALITDAALSEMDIEDELTDDEDIPLSSIGNEVVEGVLAARDADEDELETDELSSDAVDLQSASIHDGSLFDRPLDDDDDVDEDEVVEENATLVPRVKADDVSGPDTRRERLIQRGRDALLARRSGTAKPGSH